jgi:G3E family GTPase
MPRYNRHHRHHHHHHHHHNRHHHRDYAAVQWRDPMTSYLIELRRNRNDEYHNTYGRSRQEFWSTISRRFVCMIFYKKKLKKFKFK